MLQYQISGLLCKEDSEITAGRGAKVSIKLAKGASHGNKLEFPFPFSSDVKVSL